MVSLSLEKKVPVAVIEVIIGIDSDVSESIE